MHNYLMPALVPKKCHCHFLVGARPTAKASGPTAKGTKGTTAKGARPTAKASGPTAKGSGPTLQL